MTTWYEKDPRRLEKEVQIMQSRSRAVLRRSGDDILWLEMITGESGRHYELATTYPAGFPYERPRAFIVSPPITEAPHRYADGSLCLHGNPTSSDARTTALSVRNRAIVWILAFEVWQVTGEWLAPAH